MDNAATDLGGATKRTGESFHTATMVTVSDSLPPPGDSELLCGRYELLRELGRGSMGVVWHALDRVSGSEVAIKCFANLLDRSTAELDAIRANYRLVQELHHPHIAAAKTLEPDHANATLVLVMEYAEGETLDQIRAMRGGALSAGEVADLLRPVAEALDFGHARGVLHRDIKPSNLLRKTDGNVKVLDFGIAATLSDPSDLGRVHPMGGTLAYMAPEQWLGRPLDGRVDQFGLAATAWELLSGYAPFGHGDPADLRKRCLSADLPKPAGMSDRVHAVLAKAMAANASERFPRCADFARAFGAAVDVPAQPGACKRMPPGLRAGLAVAAAGLVALFAAQMGRTPPPTPAPRLPASAPVPFAGLRYHALVIGINTYGEGWNDLQTAQGDAAAVADLLETAYGFSVTRLFDQAASRQGMMQALDRIASLEADDALLIYYAGHGLHDPILDEGFWIPANGRPAREGALARESWIWNSTLTKILNTSRARHILLVADACYSGSLFRHDATPASNSREWQWYRLAFQKPSRFVITSGDLEAVQDSGGRHSVFARQLLHYLSAPDQAVFSASDLGLAIRGRVSELTGQHMRMGQLAMPAHGGGEFVFVSAAARESAASHLAGTDPVLPGFAGTSRDDRVRDVIELQQSGATNAARRTARLLLGDTGAEDPLRLVLAAGLQQNQTEDRMDRVVRLLEALETAGPQAEALPRDGRYAQPRIVALVGPPPGGHPLHQALATGLRREFARQKTAVVVDRELLGDVLQELQLENAGISDPRLAQLIGRLLPAGILVAWDFLEYPDRNEIDLRVVETATTRLLASEGHVVDPDAGLEALLAGLCSNVFQRIEAAHPLEAGVLGVTSNGLWRVGFGRFHAVDTHMSLRVYAKAAEDHLGAFPAETPREIGSATWVELGETESLLRPSSGIGPTWESARIRATR